MALILSVSYDESLLHTRSLLLNSAGYSVTSAFGLKRVFVTAEKAALNSSYSAIRSRNPISNY